MKWMRTASRQQLHLRQRHTKDDAWAFQEVDVPHAQHYIQREVVGKERKEPLGGVHARWQLHPAYSYAHSSGLFMGVSLEGSVLSARNDVNAKFYGRTGLTGEQILDLPPPKAAAPLYASLEQALMTEIPQDGFRPSQLFQDKANAAASSSGSSTGSSSLATSDNLFAPP